MVLFFKSTGKSRSDAKKRMSYRHDFLVVDPPAVIYMGKDKVESMWKLVHASLFATKLTSQRTNADEDLIKYAWPQDVWFHVDKLSSAHVYLRMPEGMTWDAIPEALLTDCAQLVKANSIEGEQEYGTGYHLIYNYRQGTRRITLRSYTHLVTI